MREAQLILLVSCLSSIYAWTGNYNVDFAHQGKPRPIPEEPVVVIPPRKIIPPGRWVNCQPIRIDEGILDHQRITHLDLPQIVLTTQGVCSYAITGPNDLVNEFFTLEQIVLDDGTNNAAAQLRLLKRLDRETAKFHTLEVTAFDCQNAVVDTVEIEISVGDINDHAPWFDPKSLILQICPDTEVNSVVGKLQGRDMDIGIYGELRYLFTYRKPYGRMMHVTRKDGTIFQMENIFSLDSTTGEIRLATDDPRIDNSIASITVEVAVRDHPDNPIFGQRAAQLIVTMCNSPPVIQKCFLGTVQEHAPAGTILEGTDVIAIDEDFESRDKFVEIRMKDKFLGGFLEFEEVREGDITTAIVKIADHFDFEIIPGADLDEDGSMTVNVPVIFENSLSNDVAAVEGECQLTIINVNEPPTWRSIRSFFFVIEECASEIGKFTDDLVAVDPDFTGKGVRYETTSEFFSIEKSPEREGHARLTLQKVIDRETDCNVEDDDGETRSIAVEITAIKDADDDGINDGDEMRSTTTVNVRCVDVNDHEPELIFSSYPIAMSICNEVERNFEDYAFLKKYGIDSNDVDFDIGDGDLDIVAIMLVEDKDDGLAGNTYPFDIDVLHEDFQVLPTNDSYVFLVVHDGPRTELDDMEKVGITIADNGKYDGFNLQCIPDEPQPQQKMVLGEPFKYVLTSCDCDENDDDEYYPLRDCEPAAAGLWWLLLLPLLLLLCCCLGFICFRICCPPPAAAVEKEDQLVYKYDKPDWYYYLYNIMSTNKKNDLLVDDATVQHPKDVRGVLIKSKEEADNVMHTHDDQKVYKFDKVHTTDNRASYALSGISDMSKLTAGAGNNDVDWKTYLADVPEYEPARRTELRATDKMFETDKMSAVSDLTDITLNVKGNNVLSDGKETGDLSRSLLRHVDTETLINRKQYVQHVENSLAYATVNQIDTLQRSKSPVGSIRNSRNTLADKMRVDNELYAADLNTSGRSGQGFVNQMNTSANSRLLNTSGDSGRLRSAGLNRSNNQGTVGTMQSAQFVQK